jgi:ATP-dependent protease ClpP protease subunit
MRAEGKTQSGSQASAPREGAGVQAQTAPAAIPHRYLTFFGNIHAPATIPFRVALTQFVNEGASEVTVLFASGGGSIDDGLALFTFIRALPVKVTFHAVGIVGSIAVPLFLATPHRLASENAKFLFHEFHWTDPQAQRVTQSTIVERTLILGSAVGWTKDVIKATTKLTDQDMDDMNMFQEPVLMDATRALQVGLVEAIVEPKIPAESQSRIVGA